METSENEKQSGESNPLRPIIWNNLSNICFKSFYCRRCSAASGKYSRFYSFFMAFSSISSASTWLSWNYYSYLWGAIVIVAQILQVAKPFLPFLKSEKDFITMSMDYRQLYLQYQWLWFNCEGKKYTENALQDSFLSLKKEELAIEKKHSSLIFPEWKRLISKSLKDTDKLLSIDFGVQK